MSLPKPYYQDGAVTLYHGDNVEVMREMEGASVDLVVTSPPYDDLRVYGGHGWNFVYVAAELTRLLRHGGVIVWVVADATIDGSETGTSMRQALHFKDVCGLCIHDTMIWNKTGFTAVGSTAVRYGPVFEYMFVLSKGKPNRWNPIKDRKNKTQGDIRHGTIRKPDGTFKPVSNKGRETGEYGIRFNIWDLPNPGVSGTEHPATFPLRLAQDHIVSWSNPSDVVLDPFSGSGTTLRAAKDLGRIAIGTEIEKRYCEIAARRMGQEVLPLDAA